MAIDANVLVFERAREEYAAAHGRKGLRPAVTTGFAKAWSAIIDSNVTTLLAAGLLFFLASGPVRGFGVTLAIGVLASMVSALRHHPGARRLGGPPAGVVIGRPDDHRHRGARPGAHLADRARPRPDEARPALAGRLGRRAGARRGRHRHAAASTSASSSPAAGWWSTPRPAALSVDDAREAVADAGFPRAVVQESGEDNISVRTGDMTNDQEAEIRAALADASGGEVDEAARRADRPEPRRRAAAEGADRARRRAAGAAGATWRSGSAGRSARRRWPRWRTTCSSWSASSPGSASRSTASSSPRC